MLEAVRAVARRLASTPLLTRADEIQRLALGRGAEPRLGTRSPSGSSRLRATSPTVSPMLRSPNSLACHPRRSALMSSTSSPSSAWGGAPRSRVGSWASFRRIDSAPRWRSRSPGPERETRPFDRAAARRAHRTPADGRVRRRPAAGRTFRSADLAISRPCRTRRLGRTRSGSGRRGRDLPAGPRPCRRCTGRRPLTCHPMGGPHHRAPDQGHDRDRWADRRSAGSLVGRPTQQVMVAAGGRVEPLANPTRPSCQVRAMLRRSSRARLLPRIAQPFCRARRGGGETPRRNHLCRGPPGERP